MKLYYAPGACSMACHIVLNALEFPYESEKVDLHSHRTETGEDYRTINPKGYVPALRLNNGQILTENAAILMYLVELSPGMGTVAEVDPLERYRRLEWLVFLSSEIHKTLGPLWNPELPPPAVQAAKEKAAGLFGYVDGHLGRHAFLLGNIFDEAADSYLFTMLTWAGPLHLDLGPWKNMQKYVRSIQDLPFVRKTMKEEGLIKDEEAFPVEAPK